MCFIILMISLIVQKLFLVIFYYKKKLYENISVYNVSYKIPTGPKAIGIRFDEIDGFII